MANVMINDLVESKELDSKAMSAVRGGNSIHTDQRAEAWFGNVNSNPTIGGAGDGNTVLVAPVVSFQNFKAEQLAFSDLVDTDTVFTILGA